MKTAWWRSLLALICGLLGASVAYLAIVLPTTLAMARGLNLGVTDPLFSLLFGLLMVGVFALGGWALTILPMVSFAPTRRWLIHPKFTELVWSCAALLAYALLVSSWAGLESLIAAWAPAIIGALSGLSYRWLMRKAPR